MFICLRCQLVRVFLLIISFQCLLSDIIIIIISVAVICLVSRFISIGLRKIFLFLFLGMISVCFMVVNFIFLGSLRWRGRRKLGRIFAFLLLISQWFRFFMGLCQVVFRKIFVQGISLIFVCLIIKILGFLMVLVMGMFMRNFLVLSLMFE